MNFKNAIGVLLVLLLLTSCLTSTNAQSTKETDPLKILLKDLTAIQLDELSDDYPIPLSGETLDGKKVPFYLVNGEQVHPEQIFNYVTNQSFKLIPYIDKQDVPQAFVFAPRSEEELLKRKMDQKKEDEAHPLYNTEASDFNVKDIDGNDYSLKDLKGKIVVLNFWFTTCNPCIKEMPHLNQLVEDYKNKNVVFLSFADDELSKIKSFLAKKQFDYKTIVADEEILKAYQIKSYPNNVVIDQSGKIAFIASGYSTSTVERIEDTLKSLL